MDKSKNKDMEMRKFFLEKEIKEIESDIEDKENEKIERISELKDVDSNIKIIEENAQKEDSKNIKKIEELLSEQNNSIKDSRDLIKRDVLSIIRQEIEVLEYSNVESIFFEELEENIDEILIFVNSFFSYSVVSQLILKRYYDIVEQLREHGDVSRVERTEEDTHFLEYKLGAAWYE